MNVNLNQQKGLTFISLVFILAIIGFFVLLALKIGPIYLDHYRVVNAINALKSTPDIQKKSAEEIRSILGKRFDMNYVSTLDVKDIKITQRGAYLKVQAAYEVVQQVIGNASVLVTFDDTIEVGEDR